MGQLDQLVAEASELACWLAAPSSKVGGERGGEVLERELRGTTYSQVAHACFSRDGQPTHHRSVGRKVAGCPRSGVAIAGADGVVAALLEDRPGRATEAGVFAEEGSAADVQRTRVCVVAAHRGVAIEAVLSTGVSYKRSTGRGGGGMHGALGGGARPRGGRRTFLLAAVAIARCWCCAPTGTELEARGAGAAAAMGHGDGPRGRLSSSNRSRGGCGGCCRGWWSG